MVDTPVRNFFLSVLDIDDFYFQLQSGYLKIIIERAFCLNKETSIEERAEIICSELFSIITGQNTFTCFLQKVATKEKTAFLSVILYKLYFNDFDWKRLSSKKIFYFFQIFASLASKESIEAILASFSYSEKIHCLIDCSEQVDEGAYHIFSQLRANSLTGPLLEAIEGGIVHPSELQPLRDISVTEEDVALFLEAMHKRLDEKAEELSSSEATPEAWKKFFSIFGLYGLQIPQEVQSAECAAGITSHLNALMHHPEQYREGLNRLVLAMPTVGKELSRQAWLPSIVASLKKFCQFFSIPLEEHPIFVFDQSDEPLFKTNEAYINELRNGVVIFHIAKKELLALAKKWHIESLVVTSSNGASGFGGARNAVFLLAPFLRHLYSREKEKLMRVALTADLREEFKRVVLGSHYAIHMGDDDVHLPTSALFSDALFTFLHKEDYFCRVGLVTGRKTVDVAGCLDLAYVLAKTEEIILQNKWTEEPFFHGMAGLLSKSKICLNVPHGQEEGSLEAMKKYYFDIRKPLIHLAGARYPTSYIPRNRFSGLALFLKKQNHYVLQLLQIGDLIDPHQLQKRCALPWNVKVEPFSSLKEALEQMISYRSDMQNQFWKNFSWYAKGFVNSPLPSSFLLEQMIHQNFSEILENFSDPLFENEMKELLDLFVDFQQEVTVYKEFVFFLNRYRGKVGEGKKMIEIKYGKKIEEFPMVYSLYLLCISVGECEFQNGIKNLL